MKRILKCSKVKSVMFIYIYGVSGMNENELLTGRPFGGCAILISNRLKCTFTPVNISNRCCAGILKFSSYSILVFNVYMPCDTCYDVANDGVFRDILNDIRSFCAEHDDIGRVLIGGDFNTDFSRNTALHTNSLCEFITKNEDFVACDMFDEANILYTYKHDASGTQTTIDHFIVSQNMFNNMIYGNINHYMMVIIFPIMNLSYLYRHSNCVG